MKISATSSRSHNPIWIAGTGTTALYITFIGLPIVALIVEGLSGGMFISHLTDSVVYSAIRLSIITTTISVIITVLVGTPLGYLLARNSSRFMRIVDLLIELPIVLPPVVAGVALLMAFGRNGFIGVFLADLGIALPFTTMAVIFAQVFVAAPFYIRAARMGFRAVDNRYEYISQAIGISPWQTFRRISLPLAGPSLLGGVGLCWARAFSEFGATIMFAGNLIGDTQTIPLAILSTMDSDISMAISISVFALIISVVVLFLMSIVTNRSNV